jgi:hypothetical protein
MDSKEALDFVGQVQTIVGVIQSAHWAVKRWAEDDKNTRAMRQAYAKEKEKAVDEQHTRLLAERLGRLEDTEHNRKRLSDLLSDEFFWLQSNYKVEAFREARQERTRMLLYAARGSVDMTLTFVDIARTERTLRMLEPDDILFLGKLAEHEEPEVDFMEIAPEKRRQAIENHRIGLNRIRGERLRGADRHSVSLDALLSTGCIRIDEAPVADVETESELVITQIGRLVLRVLSDYLMILKADNDDR